MLGYETSHHVSGIFFEAITFYDQVETIGVTLEPNPQETKNASTIISVPALKALKPKNFFSENIGRAFVSKAAFAGAKTIRAQQHGSRYTGLLATFEDETKLALGQWDPSQLDTISLIYTREQGPLSTIVFILSEVVEKDRLAFKKGPVSNGQILR
ncbi:unnamed protein product, partial [Clonostachys byssicola]